VRDISPGAALLMTKQIVTFRLGDDLFAADILSIERVLRYSEPRSMPSVPAWIEGVIDYQARVVPVVDLRKRFELDAAQIAPATRLIILSVEGDLVGGIVDEVLEVAQVATGAISSPPAIFRGLSAEFVQGMVRRNEKIIIVLDFARLFSTNERIALVRAGEEEST
jgi:purine-binding chemotaxis protein CheW